MRVRKTWLAVPALAAGVALATAPLANAAHEGVYEFQLTDTFENGGGATSTATITAKTDELLVEIDGTGFAPGLPVVAHLHGALDPEMTHFCPGPEVDGSEGQIEDGFVNTIEGLADYGGVVVSLTTEGGISSEAADSLALERFPVADEDGDLSYERTFTTEELPEGFGMAFANMHIVQHGIDVDGNGNGEYNINPDVEGVEEGVGAGVSPFAKVATGDDSFEAPLEATLPTTCGETELVSAAGATGGVETGGEGTSGIENAGLFAAGGIALAGAATVFAVRRRSSTG